MANGIVCKHCGCQEANHTVNEDQDPRTGEIIRTFFDVDDPNECLPGYTTPIAQCSGYEEE